MSLPLRFGNPCSKESLEKHRKNRNSKCALPNRVTGPLNYKFCKDVNPKSMHHAWGAKHITKDLALRLQAAILKKNVWDQNQDIRIAFLDGSEEQKRKVREIVMRNYQPHINLTLIFDADPRIAEVRVSFNPKNGSWSYLGKDALNVEYPEPTMNLGWMDKGNILHEFGHCIGPWVHEHQNDRDNPIQWNVPVVISSLCGPPNDWNRETICQNMFPRYAADQIRGSKYDPDSIMQYPYPASWTLDGKANLPRKKLSFEDVYWLRLQYPRASRSSSSNSNNSENDDDNNEVEDEDDNTTASVTEESELKNGEGGGASVSIVVGLSIVLFIGVTLLVLYGIYG